MVETALLDMRHLKLIIVLAILVGGTICIGFLLLPHTERIRRTGNCLLDIPGSWAGRMCEMEFSGSTKASI